MFIFASSALSIVRCMSPTLALVCSSDTGMMLAPLAYSGCPLTLVGALVWHQRGSRQERGD